MIMIMMVMVDWVIIMVIGVMTLLITIIDDYTDEDNGNGDDGG